jgi:glycosyltransferase involved in cell wall biosynthesis
MLSLVLFFTRDISLRMWSENGSFEREIALYLRLQEKGVQVSFITYGDKTDLQYRDRLHGIQIFCNRWGLPPHQYERLIPLLHAPALARASLIKSHQTNGADVALRAARIWRKPMVARCGYMFSEFAQRQGNTDKMEFSVQIEKEVFTHCQRIIVTTPSMKHSIMHNYEVNSGKISVFPNYVLTEQFSPRPISPVENRIVFVGRLVEQKNLFELLSACEGLPVELHFVGEGPLRPPLQHQAGQNGVHLTLHGNLPHFALPSLICSASVFVLPSNYEGHPKSLLEAMSCGVAVLGADSPGIREQIVHGETGWLCGTDSKSIRKGIQHLLANPSLCETLGRNARRFIQENYSIDNIVEMEYSLIKEVVGGTK